MKYFVIAPKTSLKACHLGKKPQSGAVLIVSLVMLTILTIIAVGTITDTNLQANMVRNNQITQTAFNVTLSELEAQYQATRNNNLVNGVPYQDILANVSTREIDFVLPPEAIQMAAADNPFIQTVTIGYAGKGNCGGGGNINRPAIKYEINATSMLDNTGINSDQTFVICYQDPNYQ